MPRKKQPKSKKTTTKTLPKRISKEEFRKEIIQAIAASFFAFIGLVIASTIFLFIDQLSMGQKKAEQTEKIEQIVTNTNKIAENIEKPYEKLSKIRKVVILENFENSTHNEKSTAWFSKDLQVQGLFKSGYLYVKASIDDQAFNGRGYVYIKIQATLEPYTYTEYGGHLLKSKSLETPLTSEYTELLFDLSDVKYKKTYTDSDIEVTAADWLSLLNNGKEQRTLGFTSTVGKGKIIELSFFYECVDNTECSITSR